MTKKEIDKKIEEISEMGATELDTFAYTVSLSAINREVKYTLNEAIAKRQKQLDKKVSVMAESSEVQGAENETEMD